MLVRAIVHRDGDRTMLEVVSNDPEVIDLKEGQEVLLTIKAGAPREISDDEFDAIVDRIIDEHREALDYLADH
jgi:hypothetical protein